MEFMCTNAIPEWAGLVLPGLWPFSALYGLKEHWQNRNATFGTYVVELGLVVKEALVSATYLHSSFIYILFPRCDNSILAHCFYARTYEDGILVLFLNIFFNVMLYRLLSLLNNGQ